MTQMTGSTACGQTACFGSRRCGRRFPRWFAWLALPGFLAICLPLPVPGQSDPGTVAVHPADRRRPVPDEQVQKKLLQDVRELFHAEWVQADTDEKRLKLAENLMQAADRLGDDPDSQFVLVRIARDIAAPLGATDTALAAADYLGRRFAVDDLDMKAGVLERVLPLPADPAQKANVANRAMTLIDVAVLRDDFKQAQRLGEIALTAARDAEDATLSRFVVARNRDVADVQAAYQGVAEARHKLAEDMFDQPANRKVGAYLCLAKGDWDRGISYLALGGDDPICRAAQADLAAQVDAATKLAEIAVEVGNPWWEISEQQPDQAARRLRNRAAGWYLVAYPSLTGFAKTRIAKRLDQVRDEGLQPQKIVKLSLPALPRVVPLRPTRPGTPGGESSPAGGAAQGSAANPGDAVRNVPGSG